MTVLNLIIALTFFATFLGLFGVNLVLSDVLDRAARRSRRQAEEQQLARNREMARDSVQSYQRTMSLGEMADEAFRDQVQTSGIEKARQCMEQAGLKMSVQHVAFISLGLGVLTGVPVGIGFGDAITGTVVGLAIAVIPIAYVLFKRQQRMDNLRSQLPDSLELMSRVMRAGQTITQAMQAVGEEFKPPIGHEFSYCYEQQNLGLSTDVALNDLAKRTGLLEVKIFVLAMLIHRQTGGNLTELLDKLAEIIRERYKIRGKIKSLTAEGRLQAAILLALPPFMYGMLLLISRQYALELLTMPHLIIGALVAMFLGALWIRRIVNFDF